MRRYLALAAIAATLLLFASQAGGQQPVHRVGVLASTEIPENVEAWLGGLRERGYVVGQNLQIEYRYFRGRYDQLPALLTELVAFDPEVIVTSTSNSAVAIHAAAPTIPLVFLTVADPVALGLVQSLAHPGGNVTELATFVFEGIIGKHLQLLKDLVPRASRIAVLINPAEKMHQIGLQRLPEAGQSLGLEFVIVEASEPAQFAAAFEKAHAQGADAIHVWNGPLVFRHSVEIVGLAARYNLPAMYFDRRYVLDGGLISYAPNQADQWRRATAYVDKILKGENPGDLPVQQPTGYYLAVNVKTAEALGLTVPTSILAQADEVIE
jgi:putative tryptophan/tyrosine transport system substrate-binding protein